MKPLTKGNFILGLVKGLFRCSNYHSNIEVNKYTRKAIPVKWTKWRFEWKNQDWVSHSINKGALFLPINT